MELYLSLIPATLITGLALVVMLWSQGRFREALTLLAVTCGASIPLGFVMWWVLEGGLISAWDLICVLPALAPVAACLMSAHG